MAAMSSSLSQIKIVDSLPSLIDTPFAGPTNALCYERQLEGDFLEIVKALQSPENITVVEPDDLNFLPLSPQGQLARRIILQDFEALKNAGASPTLNIIQAYERDADHAFFPTDVYSFHVDRSPIPTSTFLCTYFGAASEILSNEEAELKIAVPEIRARLRSAFKGSDTAFETYLIENYYDLHYQPKAEARPLSLGNGHLWRLAVDYPGSPVLPCIHRAPIERKDECRLLLIC